MFVIVHKNDNNKIMTNSVKKRMFFFTEDNALTVLERQPNKDRFFVRKTMSEDYKKAHKKRTVNI